MSDVLFESTICVQWCDAAAADNGLLVAVTVRNAFRWWRSIYRHNHDGCRDCCDVRRAKSTEYNDDGNRMDRWFRHALGSSKAPRHGESVGRHLELNPLRYDAGQWQRLERDRRQMRELFDGTFWSRGQRTGRLVYVCFCGAAVVAMSRLVEVARRKGQTCRGMHVVALPWGDPIPQASSGRSTDAARAMGLMQTSRSSLTARCYGLMFERYAKLFHLAAPGASRLRQSPSTAVAAIAAVRLHDYLPPDVRCVAAVHEDVHRAVATWPAGRPLSGLLYAQQQHFRDAEDAAQRLQSMARGVLAAQRMAAARRVARAVQTFFFGRRAVRLFRAWQMQLVEAASLPQWRAVLNSTGEFVVDALLEAASKPLPPTIALEDEYKARRIGVGGLRELARSFKDLGGNVLFVEQPFELEQDPRDYGVSIGIRPSDVVFPVCHAGENRSQAMHRVLVALKRAQGADLGTVVAPHGALSGYDPYVGFEGLNEDNFFQWVHGFVRRWWRCCAAVDTHACFAADATWRFVFLPHAVGIPARGGVDDFFRCRSAW